MISYSDLTYFLEAAITLNFSRSAERLGISQPSLSQAIARLEQEMSVEVFIRHKRGVTLTPAGRELLLNGRKLQEHWQKVKAESISSMREVKGRYTIGCHPSVAIYSLPFFLPKLMADHPNLEINLVHDLSRKITEGVISSKIDLGIAINPVRHPDLVIQALAKDEVSLWIKAPRSKTKLQLMDLVHLPIIFDADMLQAQTLIRKIAKATKAEFRRTITTPNLELIRELTASGCGVGILPARVANLSRTKLYRIDDAPVFMDEVCAIFRVEQKGVIAIQHILREIKEVFRQS